MKECNFTDVLETENLIFVESPVIYRVFDRLLDDLDSDEEYQYNIIKDLVDGIPRYLNDIMYAVSGYMETKEWKELINKGSWFIQESEVEVNE